MKLERILKFASTCVAVWLGAVACSNADEQRPNTGDGGATGTAQRSVEVFSWWIAPGEAEAFQSLVDLNKQLHPQTRVFNAALDSGDNARAELARRLDANDPPDLFQQNAHDIAAFLTRRPGTLQPLDDLLAATGLDTAIQADVLKDVTFGGHVYGLPVNIHRENALFYNKQLFKEAGIAVPTSTPELLAACETFKAAGVTPIATAHQGWILRILFNSLAMGYMGSNAFNAFMSGGERDDVALRGAIDLFDDVLTKYVNDDAEEADFGWTDAAELVANGEAAMFFHGDWAKGFYGQLGWTAGVDFGVVGAPGASDMFWYGVDVFSLPTGAQNAPSAQEFLTTIGSVQGQLAFNRIKGSTPVRLDVPKAQLDIEGRATLDDFANATYRTFVVSLDAWDAAMLAFAEDHDKDALFQAYVDHPPQH
ncbi:MAG TPA: ABC transporter substrate-binding protein [Polyangiaceae bacterium]|nr:ABC transporter substrate-binding protein [Polyangiaceae bacterium]